MEAYTDFASVYDEFMEETPYDAWCAFIESRLKEDGITEGLILDLGCGTGAMTERLKALSYDMIGVDSSEEMLRIATEKGDRDILYLLQDMREFELYGTVRAIVSVCDCVNYITDPKELLSVFRLVNNYLDPKGLFIFDFNTPYKYGEVIGDTVIAENREDKSFIWENYWYPEEHINEYDVTIYQKEEDGRYRRFAEEHYQRAYTLSEIKKLASKAGLSFVAAYDDYTEQPVTRKSERIVAVFREQGK